MAKYRILTSEELHELKDEFIKFLVLNGIPADDWEKMKGDPEKADRMIELFSDVVFEKILRQITYLKHVSKSSIKIFHCKEEEIHLIGLDSDSEAIDLSAADINEQLEKGAVKHLKVYQASKTYNPSREEELFRMMQNGCVKSDGGVYKILLEQVTDE